MLRQHRGLLIWDNFETVASMPEPGQATPPLDEAKKAELLWFIGELRKSKSALLITSRSEERWLGGPESFVRCEVGGLSERDALQYADHLLAPHAQASARRAAEPERLQRADRLSGRPSLEPEAHPAAAFRGEPIGAAGGAEGPGRAARRLRRGGGTARIARREPLLLLPASARRGSDGASSSCLCSRRLYRQTFSAT